MNNFYCKIKCCADDGLTIEERNQVVKEIEEMKISEAEKKKLLYPEPCKSQCQSCIDTVQETQSRTKQLMDSQVIRLLNHTSEAMRGSEYYTSFTAFLQIGKDKHEVHFISYIPLEEPQIKQKAIEAYYESIKH